MRAKLEVYGVTVDVEGTYEECSRIVSVWYVMGLAVVRAQHGDVAGAEAQLAEAIAKLRDGATVQ